MLYELWHRPLRGFLWIRLWLVSRFGPDLRLTSTIKETGSSTSPSPGTGAAMTLSKYWGNSWTPNWRSCWRRTSILTTATQPNLSKYFSNPAWTQVGCVGCRFVVFDVRIISLLIEIIEERKEEPLLNLLRQDPLDIAIFLIFSVSPGHWGVGQYLRGTTGTERTLTGLRWLSVFVFLLNCKMISLLPVLHSWSASWDSTTTTFSSHSGWDLMARTRTSI